MIYKTLHRKLKIEQHEPHKNGGEFKSSRRVNSSCSTRGTRRITLVTYPMTSHEWGMTGMWCSTNGTYPWSFETQVFRSG